MVRRFPRSLLSVLLCRLHAASLLSLLSLGNELSFILFSPSVIRVSRSGKVLALCRFSVVSLSLRVSLFSVGE